MSDKETKSPNAELQALTDELHATFEQFKQLNEKRLGEVEEFGTELGDSKERIGKVEKALEEIELKIERATTAPTPDVEVETEDLSKFNTKAFEAYCRKGLMNMDPELRKALTVGDDTTGGYLAPPDLVATIIKEIVEYDPIRELARSRTTSLRAVQMPRKTASGSVFWTGAETATKQENPGPRWGMLNIPVHEASSITYISNEDLEDTAFDIQGEIREDVVEQHALGEGAAFISGDGVSKPEGLLTNPEMSEVNSGDASLLTADGLMDIYYDLKSVYAQNGTWLMNRASVKAIRQFKDQQDQYLWQPGIAGVAPNTILGAPYRESPSMPNISAGTYPVIFGDFRRGYLIVDRLAMQILRDDLTEAGRGLVRFISRRRVGGQVILAEALRKQKVSA